MTTNTTSFLHAASAKINANKRWAGAEHQHHQKSCGEALRLLLVEEENNVFAGMSLARSLIMDAAQSSVSNSLVPCRGCCEGEENDSEKERSVCRCCRVALLIPGAVEKSKRKKRRKNGNFSNGSNLLGDAGKAPFPMPCRRVRDGICDGESLDAAVLPGLDGIHIKYVHSLSDVIQYLAYAPSLPAKFQPLNGIYLMGLGELMGKQHNNSMEFTHILSILSDTANVLEDKRRQILDLHNQSAPHPRIGVVATISHSTYSSIPTKVINYHHQWIDFMAAIQSAHDDVSNRDSTNSQLEWDLVFKNTGIRDELPKTSDTKRDRKFSFGFKVKRVNESEDRFTYSSHEIAWAV